jgi:hypothetical protein
MPVINMYPAVYTADKFKKYDQHQLKNLRETCLKRREFHPPLAVEYRPCVAEGRSHRTEPDVAGPDSHSARCRGRSAPWRQLSHDLAR